MAALGGWTAYAPLSRRGTAALEEAARRLEGENGRLRQEVVRLRREARALAGDPPVILADEPTAALDSHSGRAVMDVLKTLAHERDRAVVIVTHDSRMLGYADRTIRMEDGRIVSDKGARDLGFGMRDSDSDSLAEGAVA